MDEEADVQARIWNLFVRGAAGNAHVLDRVGKGEEFLSVMVITGNDLAMVNNNIYAKYGIAEVPSGVN